MIAITDDEALRQCVLSEPVSDALIDAGWSKPLVRLTTVDCSSLIKEVLLNCVILKIKAELDAFITGLEESSILIHIRT